MARGEWWTTLHRWHVMHTGGDAASTMSGAQEVSLARLLRVYESKIASSSTTEQSSMPKCTNFNSRPGQLRFASATAEPK